MQHHPRRLLLSICLVAALSSPAWADVTRVAIASRTVVANGQWFGAAGPYEKIAGTVFFELDPADPHNKAIADIELAPRNAQGRVEFSADLFILAPQDPSRASGSVLFEISNRGNKGLLTTFNRGTGSSDPMLPEHFGDGLLMRNGVTLVWVGWEFDVPGIKVVPPIATRDGKPIVETVTTQAVVDVRTTEAMFSDAPLYPPFDMNDELASLTVRDRVWDMPATIPRRNWQFAAPDTSAGGRCGGDAKCPRISMASGFSPGRIYELKYRVANPPVSGVGLAAIRDVASAIKNGHAAVPVRGRYLHVYGASQSGRFLRLFLHDGFNTDEQGRRVFDGMMPHIAGAGRADFNMRFSQAVGLDQFGALRFPFSDAAQRDEVTGRTDGLLAKYASPDSQPKIVYTNSSVEYWGTGRAAALVHTSIDGKADLTLPANVRVYHFAGTQHGPAAFPPRAELGVGANARGVGAQLPNPTPHTIGLRAAFMALDRWVRDGVEPPASQYPRLSDGTLTSVANLKWPALNGVASPAGIPEPRRAGVDGPPGAWPFLVPQVDEDGNELAGIRLPDQAVPIGTLTGWNFRAASGGNPTAIVPLLGSLIPFAKTAADRGSDPRKSLEERYRAKADYLGRVTEAGLVLVKQGYVLREDLPYLLERAAAGWDWVTARPAATGAQR
jgi:hypothetical protein